VLDHGFCSVEFISVFYAEKRTGLLPFIETSGILLRTLHRPILKPVESRMQWMFRCFLSCVVLFCASGLTTIVSGQSSLWHNSRLSGTSFQADFELLESMLKATHGGLTKYATGEELDALALGLKDTDEFISLHQAYARLARYIDAIRDGHTWIMPAEAQAHEILSHAFLPFTVKVQGFDVCIDQNYSDCLALNTGTVLTAIDGQPVREIIRELLPYFTADGYSLSGKLGGLESQFWWYYSLHFGFKRVHEVAFKRADGTADLTLVAALRMNDRINDLNEIYARYDDYDDPVVWSIHGDAALLQVHSFSSMSLRKYRQRFIAAMSDFNASGCKYLVIDIRGNGGGREGVENLLLSCLGQRCEEKYDAVEIRAPYAPSYRHFRHGFKRRTEDWVYTAVEFRRNDDHRWERRNRFKRSFVEIESPFTGPVGVLIDRNTFSGASEFAALVRDNVPVSVLIGEETCGGYQGHTSGYAYELVLPNTGFIVHIPRIWFDLNVPGTDNGGVRPHVFIAPNLQPHEGDVVLDFALAGGWVQPLIDAAPLTNIQSPRRECFDN